MAENPELSVIEPPTTKSELNLRFELCPQGIGKLFGALAKARKAFKPVLKTSKNPFYKSDYADLAETLAATTDALSDNGIAVIQAPTMNDGKAEIVTFMGHESGEWVKSVLPMPISKNDAQGVGASITYGRRYAYSAMVNVASEPDDDGNAASGKVVDDEKYAADFDQRTEGQRSVLPHQVNAWNTQIGKVRTEAQAKAYLANLGLKSINEMQRQDFNEAIKWLLNPSVSNLTQELKDSVKAVAAPAGAKPLNFARLFATAHDKGVPEADVKQYAYETFKIDSMTKLTPAQFKEVLDWIGSLG